MLYCFLQSQACRLIMAADYASGGGSSPPASAAPLYVGVAAWAGTAPVFAAHLLALLTGAQLPANRTVCDSLAEPVSMSESPEQTLIKMYAWAITYETHIVLTFDIH